MFKVVVFIEAVPMNCGHAELCLAICTCRFGVSATVSLARLVLGQCDYCSMVQSHCNKERHF